MQSKKGLLLVGFVFCLIVFSGFGTAQELKVIPVDTSSDGVYVLLTNEFYHGLVLLNNETGKTTIITNGRNAGYYATISNERFVCYKSFLEDNGRYLQKPVIYDIHTGKEIALTDWQPLVGTPTIALDGTIAYTIGEELILTDPNLNLIEKINLGYHVNLLDFSEDGTKITFNDANGQIVILNWKNKNMTFISSENGFWGPKFSPAGDKIIAPTINGYTALVDVLQAEIKSLTKGQALGWIDNNSFACLDKIVDEKQGKVIKSNMVVINSGDLSKEVVEVNSGDAFVALKGLNVAVVKSGNLELGQMMQNKLNTWPNRISVPVPGKDAIQQGKNSESQDGFIGIQSIYDGVYSRYLTGLPYIHQVYDTPNEFNGHWACGATSALMAIQYYGVLAAHPITVDVPYSHTSNYGWYVSNVYTYGRTFNIYGQDPNGNWFAGGYGYIIQNNWEDTKGHMAEYIQYHGRGSGVDWSPYWSEFQGEINNNHPFVVLTSLTSAGHYITARGYYWSQHTGVFNDPYGNKNSGYMNYSGSLVSYDWPGYNNGYANLNTVHCFIYCR